MPSSLNAPLPKLKRKFPPEAEVDDWGLTPAQQDAKVEEMRGILVARGAWKPCFDFHTLLRFLRAREYELDKAVSMFLDHLQWRQENRVDHILHEFDFKEREEFLSIYPQGYHKTDKKGHPVYIQHLGRVDMPKIRQVSTDERTVKYHIQEYERCLKTIFPICSRVAGRQIDKSFAIMDVKGVGFYHLTKDVRQMLATVTKIDQDNYPETLYHTCIINAPAAFRAIWAIVKPMLNARTQAKVEVCPRDYLPSLLQWIDIEDIPEYLGGKSHGTLVDDLGPWKNPELLRQLSTEQASSIEDESEAEDGNKILMGSDFGDVVEDHPAASHQETEVTEQLSFLTDPPKSSRNPLLPPTPDITSPTPSSPSVISRTKALTERIRDLEIAMSHRSESLRPYIENNRLPNFKRPPKESLMTRVEILEHGMEVLLEAQERLWHSRQQKKSSMCCMM